MTVQTTLIAILAFVTLCNLASIVLSDWLGFTNPAERSQKTGRHRRA